MVFVKLVKNKAYFKRFRTKLKRRREGRTDYRARRALITQDVNKYNTPKYRLVVRITNKDVISQIVYSKIRGDITLAAAYSHELPRFGAKVGLTNYAACYSTGLLLARRVLAKLGMGDKYQGTKEANGKAAAIDVPEDGPRPFKAVLDIGLFRTTTGARIFGVMKGAIDGGLNIPHSPKRFPGWDKEKGEINSEAFRKRILGVHVAEYQRTLQKDDEERYKSLFGGYIKNGIKPDGIEAMWKKTHEAIRKDPSAAPKKDHSKVKRTVVHKKALTKTQRVHRRNQKKAALQSLLQQQ
jgi:large subunit ribosomal protein L5e